MVEENSHRLAGLPAAEVVVPGKDHKPFLPIHFLRRRGVTILVIGAILTLLVFIPLNFSASRYTVSGSLVVKPASYTSLSGQERQLIPGDVGAYQSTLAQQFISLDTVAAALDKMTEDEKPDFLKKISDPSVALARILSHLVVISIDRSYQIQLSLTGRSSVGLSELLRSLMTSFVQLMQKKQEKQYDDRLTYLRYEKETVESHLSEERDRVVNLSRGMDDRAILRQSFTSDMDMVTVLQQVYVQAESEYLVKQALANKAQKDTDEIIHMSLEGIASGMVFDNLGINEISQWTYVQSQDLRGKTDGLTTNNPEREIIESRMTAMNDYMVNYKKETYDAIIKNITEKRRYELTVELLKAKHEADEARKVAEGIENKLQEARQHSSLNSEIIYKANQINYGIDQLKDRLSSLNLRIDDTKMDAKAPLPFYIDTLPNTPQRESVTKKVFTKAMMFGFGLPFILLALIEYLDPNISYRSHLNAVLGATKHCTVAVPKLPGTEHHPRFILELMDKHPDHPFTEAIYDVAFKLSREYDEFGARVIGVAGCEAGDGSTSIALAVSQSLGNMGYPVVLLELPNPQPNLATMVDVNRITEATKFWSMDTTALELLLRKEDRHEKDSSNTLIVPWDPAASINMVRNRLERILKTLTMKGAIVILDLSNPDEVEFTRTRLPDCNVLLMVARQSNTFYSSARKLFTLATFSGVPAISAVLNRYQSLDDPIYVYLVNYIRRQAPRIQNKLSPYQENKYIGIYPPSVPKIL